MDVVFRDMVGPGSVSMTLDSFSSHRGSGILPQPVTPSPTAPHPVPMLPALRQSHSPFPFLCSHCGEKHQV